MNERTETRGTTAATPAPGKNSANVLFYHSAEAVQKVQPNGARDSR